MKVEINPDLIDHIRSSMKNYSNGNNSSVVIGFLVGKQEEDSIIAEQIWIPPQEGFTAAQGPGLLSGSLEDTIRAVTSFKRSIAGIVQYNANTHGLIPSINALRYKDALTSQGYPPLLWIMNMYGKNKIES